MNIKKGSARERNCEMDENETQIGDQVEKKWPEWRERERLSLKCANLLVRPFLCILSGNRPLREREREESRREPY